MFDGNALGFAVNLDDIGSTHPNGALRVGQATHTHSCDTITTVPSALRSAANMFPEGIQSHYRKYTEAYGIPIIGMYGIQILGMYEIHVIEINKFRCNGQKEHKIRRKLI